MKFFRRIRFKALKTQKIKNYITYAIGEILLVVIGIFIAIQINQRYEQEKQNDEGHKILESLLVEFKQNQVQLDGLVKDYKWVYESSDYLIKNFGPELKNLPASTLDSLMGGILYVPEYYPSESVYNLMINTGKFDLIQNDSIKLAITNTKGLYPLYEMTARRVDQVTFEKLHKIMDEQGYPMKNILGGRLTSFGRYRDTISNYNYENMFNNHEFENTLELRRICTSDVWTVAEWIKKSQDDAIVKIEYELAKN